MASEKNSSTSNKLLLMSILFCIFQAVSLITSLICGYVDISWYMESILMAVLSFLLYRSYRSHTKNIMKPLVGATLVVLLWYNMDNTGYYIQYFNEYLSWFPNKNACILYLIFQIIIFILLAAINIMHYIINSTHHSSPSKIKINKGLYTAFVVFTVLKCITSIFFNGSIVISIEAFASSIADTFILASVLIIESSLDEFRILREAKANEAADAQ